ncbi:ABC transporter ATP-binding protein [uncultured Helcococcus sp.]|uniref:ABC transporter ATP-binding protein n=1 Tax=uncultured Helcococcus sp. TaxID=1072508 RepID=UPI0028896BB4|nr:ABC transporter ATP-binding protein [uncultured Helcococcus sp.]
MAYIEFNDVHKIYKMGNNEIHANNGVNFKIDKGEFVVMVGASGAGKSTTLNILGGLDTVSKGQVIVDGNIISDYDEKALTEYRRYDIGFVFQFYNLISNLTSLENVEMATQIVEDAFSPKETLKMVGLDHRIDNFPSQLSGGEQQRVAIARALAKNPKILLCDEPTGALDYKTGKQILKLLHDTCRKTGTTVIVITHNAAIAPMADKIIHLKDAKVQSVEKNANPKAIEDIEW